MAVIQERCDHVGTAGRPRLAMVQAGKHGGHQMRIPAHTIKAGTVLGIIMWHVKYMAWKEKKRPTLRYEQKPDPSFVRDSFLQEGTQTILGILSTSIGVHMKMSIFKCSECFFWF